jgi:TrmH family RNA methyltransferase
MGSLGRVEVVYGNLSQWFATLEIPLFAAEMNGTPSREVLFPKDCILLIGNEGQGVSHHLRPFIQQSITIERRGKAESLNAAMATTILVDRYFGQVF